MRDIPASSREWADYYDYHHLSTTAHSSTKLKQHLPDTGILSLLDIHHSFAQLIEG